VTLLSLLTSEIRVCQWEVTGKFAIKIVLCIYKPETKTEKEVENTYSKPNQKIESINSSVLE
jgi:hypothetical protein